MKDWILLAIISMIFAGATSVFAKLGMSNVTGETALSIRTLTVFLIISTWFLMTKNLVLEFSQISLKDSIFLVLSGVTTSLSWIFFYKSMKIGDINYVSAIDKGQIFVTAILAYFLLGEQMSWKLLIGTILIIIGTLVLTLK